MTNPRLDKPMKLFGGSGFYLEYAGELPIALEEALSAQVPNLIEILIDP